MRAKMSTPGGQWAERESLIWYLEDRALAEALAILAETEQAPYWDVLLGWNTDIRVTGDGCCVEPLEALAESLAAFVEE